MYSCKKGKMSLALVVALFVLGSVLLFYQLSKPSLTGAPTFYPNGTVCLALGESFFANGQTYVGPICIYPPCEPKTCSDLGADCGTADDGCDGTLQCGSCQSGYQCTNNKCVCQPKSCADQGAECGNSDDGCGSDLDCGSCLSSEICQGNVCVLPSCVPKTCSELGAQCGTLGDGCAGTVNCGSCTDGKICNTATNQCGLTCIPATCISVNAECGNPSDGCEGTLNCGVCGEAEICGAQYHCVPQTIDPDPDPDPLPDNEIFPLSVPEIKRAFENEKITISVEEMSVNPQELTELDFALESDEKPLIEEYTLHYTNTLPSPVALTMTIKDSTLPDLPEQEKLVRKMSEQLGRFFTAKEAETIAQQKVTGLKWMDFEEMQTLLGKTTASGNSRSLSGIRYSGQIIEGDWLQKRFLNCDTETIVLLPGQTFDKSCYVRKEFSLKSRPDTSLVLSSRGEEVLLRPIQENPTITADAAIDVMEGNKLDVYVRFPPAQGEEHFVEITIGKPVSGWWSKIVSRSEFSDTYGPFMVSGEGLFLTQQLEYDPQLYSGEYEVRIVLYKKSKILAEKEITVLLGEERQKQNV